MKTVKKSNRGRKPISDKKDKTLKESVNSALRKTDVSGWRMFSVELTLNNGLKTKYISSMEGIDQEKAKEIAIKQDWISGVKSVDSVSFDACR